MSAAIRLFQFFEKRSVRIVCLGGAVLGVVAVFLIQKFWPAPEEWSSSPAARAWSETRDITFGLRGYYADHEQYPEGDAVAICAALKGENPTKMIYVFEIPRDESGAFVDPWGAPYRIDLTHGDGARVYSCGPNKTDEAGADDSDDVASWR